MSRAAMQAALEALAAGDVREAEAILLAALEEAPTSFEAEAIGRPSPRQTFRCPDCSSSYQWPGELSHHRGVIHGVWEDAA